MRNIGNFCIRRGNISEDFVKDSASKIFRMEVGLAGTGSPGGKSLKLGPGKEGER